MIRIVRSALVAAVVLVSSTALADWPGNVTKVKSEKGKTVTVHGKFESGAKIDDLTWAANSSMACFPATQNEKFRGNHVLFATDIPPRSEMYVTVTPKDPSKDVSIWGYTIGTTNFRLPPTITSCTACEAEHKWDRPKKGKTQDHSRTIKFTAIGNPYNVVIGVSGPAGTTAGDFDLKIETK